MIEPLSSPYAGPLLVVLVVAIGLAQLAGIARKLHEGPPRAHGPGALDPGGTGLEAPPGTGRQTRGDR